MKFPGHGRPAWLFMLAAFLSACVPECSRRETVVAEFGKHRLSLEEFRAAYLELIKQPNRFDSRQMREAFLDEMIERRVLAGEAKKRGMGDRGLQIRIDAYRDRCMRDLHFERVIRPQIRTDEALVEEAYLYMQEERRVRTFAAGTREEADSLKRWLVSGMPHPGPEGTIHEGSLPGGTISGGPASGGGTGDEAVRVRWTDLDFNTAMAVFRLEDGGITEPLQTDGGYRIFQVTDHRKVPLVTRQAFETGREGTKRILEQKIGDSIAKETLAEIMKNVSIQVRPRVLERVGDPLGRVLERKPSPVDGMREIQLNDPEIAEIEAGLLDIENEVLAEIDGDPLTVRNFIAYLAYVPYDAVYRSYKEALDFVFRDFVITREARAMGFDRNPGVRMSTGLYEEYLLQLRLRRALVRETGVEEREIREFYDRHPELPLCRAPYDSVRKLLEERLIREKRAGAVPDKVRALLEKSEVKKYPERIHAFYESL